MFSQTKRGRANASAYAMKHSAIMDDFDAGGSGGGGGFGRIIGVVLLMLIVAIGGILVFKGFDRNDGEPIEPAEQPVALVEPKSEPRRDTPGLAERRNGGKPVIFDHPTMNGFKRYRVGSSETLTQIAEAFSANIAEVEKLNNVSTGTRLYAGQWLTIPDNRTDKSSDPEIVALVPTQPKLKPPVRPPVSAPPVTASKRPNPPEATAAPISRPAPVKSSAPTSEPKSSVGSRIYKVISGDTAYRISLKYGITWQELLKFNGMEDPRELKAGQVLKIPD